MPFKVFQLLSLMRLLTLSYDIILETSTIIASSEGSKALRSSERLSLIN